jgi:hypothetical protein
VQADIEKIDEKLSKDATAMWVRWAIPLVVTAVVSVYGVLDARIRQTETADAAFMEESFRDRRQIAEKTATLEARQREQFERILGELKYLNDRITQLSR